jgi:hypothetical protein
VDAKNLYLDLLKHTLTGMVYEDPSLPVSWRPETAYDQESRVNGTDWPQTAPSMIGLARMHNVQSCVERVLADEIPGDLAEAGVWRGGTCILMRALLALYQVTDRRVWVIDSFDGFPPQAVQEGFGHAEQRALAVTRRQVQHNFELYGMLDAQVQFLEGYFADTLPTARVGPLAVLRMDGDLFSSTTDVLVNLYPKLSPGGYVIIDDWQLPARQATEAYRETHQISEPVLPVEGSLHGGQPVSAFWRKETETPGA